MAKYYNVYVLAKKVNLEPFGFLSCTVCVSRRNLFISLVMNGTVCELCEISREFFFQMTKAVMTNAISPINPVSARL